MKKGDTLATYNGFAAILPLEESRCGCFSTQIRRAVTDKGRVFIVVQCAGCAATWEEN